MDRYDHGLGPKFAIHCMMLDRHYHLIYEVMGPSIKYVVNEGGIRNWEKFVWIWSRWIENVIWIKWVLSKILDRIWIKGVEIKKKNWRRLLWMSLWSKVTAPLMTNPVVPMILVCMKLGVHVRGNLIHCHLSPKQCIYFVHHIVNNQSWILNSKFTNFSLNDYFSKRLKCFDWH